MKWGIIFLLNVFLFAKTFIATGYSAENQPPRAAYIAAKLDAQRQLLEQISNVKIDSTTTVKDAMLEDDTIRTRVQGLLKNAKVIKTEYDYDKRYAKVTMAINYNKLAAVIVKNKKLKFKNLYTPSKIKIEKTCDGLIIDVRGKDFEPAIINKIFYKNEIIYDPTKVPQSVIIQRGLASFTNSINKAKAILDSYHSYSPCVVKPLRVLNKTDVEISKKDADLISSSNEKNAFLQKARIVFVMDK